MQTYNKFPKLIYNRECVVEEFFSYTYLPIKLKGAEIVLEPRLEVFKNIIGIMLCDFVGEFGVDKFTDSYIYLTAKHLYQFDGFNRKGWHSDGFGTKDISYIWYDRQPTIFNTGNFKLSNCDQLSMAEMQKQADERLNFTYPDNSILRMDQYTIHKVGDVSEGPRCFIKVCFSEDIYNLKGNSINHLIDYNWEYRDRKIERNVPQEL